MGLKGFLVLAAVLALFVVGFLFFGAPLEIPSLKVAEFACIGNCEDPLSIRGFPFRATVVQQWVGMVVLIGIAFVATRKIDIVPGRMQALVEIVVELLLGLCERAAGAANGRRFFPVIATIFLFILSANWLGLLPGVGTVGVVEPASEALSHAHEGDELEFLVFDGNVEHDAVVTLPVGETAFFVEDDRKVHVTAGEELPVAEERAGHLVPFLRPANTDVNTPLAIAIWSFIFVEFWGISTLGLGYFLKFFNVGRLLRGNLFMGAIDVFVGLLELVSELVRLVSFTFRLFGNIFAGEILILMAAFFLPLVAGVGVFAMELFFGMIQAFIFAILTLIFGVLAVTSHGGGHEDSAEGAHH